MEGLFKPTYKTTDVHDSQYTVKQNVDAWSKCEDVPAPWGIYQAEF